MKNQTHLLQIIPFLIILSFAACTTNQHKLPIAEISQIHTDISPRKLIESKEYLTVPLSPDDLKTIDMTKLSGEETAKIKAALYRFYSHVELTAVGTYQINVSSGNEIGISETLFTFFKNGVEEINILLNESGKGETKYHAPEISAEYLEGLLD